MFKNEFVTKEQIDAKFDARLAALEDARIDALIAEAAPTSAPVGMGFPPLDPATGLPTGAIADQPSRVQQIESEIADVRKLRDEALKSAAKA